MNRILAALAAAALCVISCSPKNEIKLLSAQDFETTIDGAPVSL